MNSISHSMTANRIANNGKPEQTKDLTGNGINANDFLTLLVSELKNQDPTQPQDPAQYVQQLVGVNSLQQLIGIRQDMDALTSTPAGATN